MQNSGYATLSEDWNAETKTNSKALLTETCIFQNRLLEENQMINCSNINDVTHSYLKCESMSSCIVYEQLFGTASETCFHQNELMEKMSLSNSILFLASGSRKLYIALNIIRRLSDQFLSPHLGSRISTLEHKLRTVIICQSNSLVHQYYLYFYLHMHSRFKIIFLLDEMTKNEDDHIRIRNAHILVMKAQTLIKILTFSFKISDLNLIIFDELLQTSTDPTSAKIMDIYHQAQLNLPNVQLPRLIGLSVHPLSAKIPNICVREIRTSLTVLTQIYSFSIFTSSCYIEALKYRMEPDYLVIPCNDTILNGDNLEFSIKLNEYIGFIDHVSNFNNQQTSSQVTYENNTIYSIGSKQWKKINIPPLILPNNFKSLMLIATDILTVLIDIGIWGCFQACILYFKHLQDYLVHNIENILLFSAISNLSSMIKRYITRILKNQKPTFDDINNKLCATINQLFVVCKEDNFNCIIFVNHYIVAYILSLYLSKIVKVCLEFKSIKSNYIANLNSEYFQESHCHRNFIISMFKLQELNLLVSNSTQFDFIEIHSLVVIMFNTITDFAHFNLSKVKLVDNGGKIFSLCTEFELIKVVVDIKEYCNMELLLRKLILDYYSPTDSVNSWYVDEKGYNFFSKSDVVMTEINAISILNWYCQYLNNIREVDIYNCWKPYFKFHSRQVKSHHYGTMYEYNCAIQMPKSCYVLSNIELDTHWSSSKLNAVKLAAFNVCLKLYELGELDEHLTPLFLKIRRLEKNISCAHPSFDFDVDFYPISIANCLKRSLELSETAFLHPFYIKNDIHGHIDSTVKSFAFLSVSPLHLNELPIIILNDWKKLVGAIQREVVFIPAIQISINSSQLKKFNLFNYVLFQQMLGVSRLIEYVYVDSKKKYLLIPILLHKSSVKKQFTFECIDVEILENLISWPMLMQNFSSEPVPQFYNNLLVRKNYTSKIEKSNLYQVIEVNFNISIDSPFPDPSKASSYKKYYEVHHQFSFTKLSQVALILMPFSNKIHNYIKQYEFKNDIVKQNIVPTFDQYKRQLKIISFPELLTPIPLLGSIAVEYRFIPSICYRLESLFLALEFIQKLEYDIPLNTCLNVLTLKRCGEEFDLERLEFFGDTCLKFIVVNHLFLTFPFESQGVLSSILAYRVKNSLLLKFAQHRRLDLPSYISGREFNPTLHWLPPGFKVKDTNKLEDIFDLPHENDFVKINHDTHPPIYTHQELYSKSIADAFESVLGGIITAKGLPNAILFLHSFGKNSVLRELEPNLLNSCPKFTCDPNQFSDDPFLFYLQGGEWFHYLYSDYKSKFWDSEMTIEYEKHFHDTHSIFVREKLNYTKEISYKHKYLIVQALTHDSYISHSFTPSYQRLCLLGDALTDYLVISFLITHTPVSFCPKDLHTVKVCLLTNKNLARICIKLGYHKEILLSSYLLQSGIDTFTYYVENVDEKDFFDNELHFIANSKSTKIGIEDSINGAQKVLSDIFKSLVASVYLISNYNLERVWQSFGHPLRQYAEIYIKLYLNYNKTESIHNSP